MPEPAGLSITGPTRGQFALGAVISFVASIEKLNAAALVKETLNLPPLNATPLNFDRTGAGMLNGELVTPVNPLEVKIMVAPVTELVLKAVKPAKVAVPLTAAFVIVPPKVQVVWTGAARMLAVLTTILLNASCTTTTG